MSYHSEPVTRWFIHKIIVASKRAPNPNLSETNERRQRRELKAKETSENWQKLSKESATSEERAEYFETGTKLFLSVAGISLLLGFIILLGSERMEYVIAGYNALFLAPALVIGSLIPPFVMKTSKSAKGQLASFKTSEFIICMGSAMAIILGAIVFFNHFLPESYFIR